MLYCNQNCIFIRYEEAENEIKRQFELAVEGGPTSNMGRVTVELFLLQLAKNDNVAAKKVLQEYGMQYCEQAEVHCNIFVVTRFNPNFCMSLDLYA